jgi:hypothetical protein
LKLHSNNGPQCRSTCVLAACSKLLSARIERLMKPEVLKGDKDAIIPHSFASASELPN